MRGEDYIDALIRPHCCQIIISEGYHVGIVTNITVNKMGKRLEGNIFSTLRGEAEKLKRNVRGVGTWYTISVSSLQIGKNFRQEYMHSCIA